MTIAIATSRLGLTVRQRDCFEFIERFIAEQKHPPSRREIAKGLGIKSGGRINCLLEGLKERGWITYQPWRARSIVIVPETPPTGYVLPPELDAKLRRHCALNNEAPADVLADAVTLFLDEIAAAGSAAA